MSERSLDEFHRRCVDALALASLAADNAPDTETALRHLTRAIFELLGDPDAHLRPDALKPGERQFKVAGIFLLTSDRRFNLLVAEHGFPAEQHRLRIPVDLGHPGWIVRNQKPLMLRNTDENADFKQILKTARMGSALFSPMFWRGALVGQMLIAAQARNTFSEPDHQVLIAFANVAAAIYAAQDGPAFLASLLTS
jgi:hypothetical protein